MKEEFESPVYHVHRVPVEKVRANSYNPNHVAAPEMKLLELSIWEDGYTMPCFAVHIGCLESGDAFVSKSGVLHLI